MIANITEQEHRDQHSYDFEQDQCNSEEELDGERDNLDSEKERLNGEDEELVSEEEELDEENDFLSEQQFHSEHTDIITATIKLFVCYIYVAIMSNSYLSVIIK